MNKNEKARKAFETFLTLAGLKKYELAEWLGFTDAALSQKIRKLSPEKTHELICESLRCVIKKYEEVLDKPTLERWIESLYLIKDYLMKDLLNGGVSK